LLYRLSTFPQLAQQHAGVEQKALQMRKTILTMLASASAIAFSPVSELRAATFVSPGSQPGTEKLAQVVKGKKAKGAKSKGPGSCGTHMYYSTKTGKCEDARAKK